MIDEKNTRNSKTTAITEEMIPIVVGNDEIRTIRVEVDGHSAACFLHDRVWYSTKVVILFDEEHPRWGEYFTTKYFMFNDPGMMNWGHNGECMKIDAILPNERNGDIA